MRVFLNYSGGWPGWGWPVGVGKMWGVGNDICGAVEDDIICGGYYNCDPNIFLNQKKTPNFLKD